MATNPIPDVAPEERLTGEESQALFESLRGILKPTFDALGGSEKFFRELRDIDDDPAF